jgi:hypothetical protein
LISLVWLVLSGPEPPSDMPSFHAYIVRTVGDPRHPLQFGWNWFARPLAEPTFAGFWRRWNPVYGYILLFWVYRPLRRTMPRPLAVFLTFVVSGFALHDVPFGNGIGFLRGQTVLPEVTILMAIFGGMTLVAELAGLECSACRLQARVLANLVLLAAGFALRRIVVHALGG